MYITAHRVRTPEGLVAIHGFRHRHDADRCPFPDDPLEVPRDAPGILEEQEVELRVGGNRVLSYLDLIAPEGSDTTGWREQLPALSARLGEHPLPVVMEMDSLTLIFSATPEIEEPEREYRLLLQTALRLLSWADDQATPASPPGPDVSE